MDNMDSDQYSCIGNACNGYSVAILAGKSSITGSQDDDVNREKRVAVAALGATTATRFSRFLNSRLLHHTAHATHATHATHAAHTSSAFLLLRIGVECIRREEHNGYTTIN